MKIIKTALLLCAILLTFISQAQQPATVSGIVKDSATQKMLAFVTVSLYKNKLQAQPVKVTYTNKEGKFSFKADTGSNLIVLTQSGYLEKRLPFTAIAGEVKELNDIMLVAGSKVLTGITVTATKPLIEQTDDKIVYNTEADPAAKSETALDILRKTPFVSVDGNDNIQVNGQGSFKVLLNGRETAMFAQNPSQALKGFPGASIVKIEVITNPSAKYDAEGVGGIINIITKKKVTGYNGTGTIAYNSVIQPRGNINFNMKKGKVGISVNYNAFGQGLFGLDGRESYNYSRTDAIQSTVFSSRVLDVVNTPKSFINFGNAEMSLDIDSMNTISVYGSVSGGRSTIKSVQNITMIVPSVPNSINSSFLTKSKSVFPSKNIGVDFVRKFKENKDKEFSVKIYGEFGTSNNFYESYQDNPGADRYIINNNFANNTQYTIQSDYVLPLQKGRKLETGAKLILRKANSDYESLLKTNPADDYKLDPVNTNNFDYAQQVYSGYGSYNFKIRKWSFRTGLRLEHTEVDGSFTGTGTKVSQSYTNLIPNLQVTRILSKAYTIVLGYSQRIQRPFINSLNPFVDNTDTLNISYGNPALHPQLIHSVSFQNRINKGKIFAGLTLTGSYSDDKVISIARYDNTTGVTTTTRENLGKELLLSLNGNITARFNKAWTLSINSNIAYLSIQNSLKASQQNKGISGSINVNNSYKINPKLTLSTFLAYFRSQVSIQGYSTGQVFYNLSASYKILKERMTIGLVTNRIFEKYGILKSYVKDQNFSTESVFKFPVRVIGVSLTWNFGKLKENVSKKKGVSNDDVL